MDRLYHTVLEQHLRQYRQMIFLAGPRQVGKTTLAESVKKLADTYIYLNWDNQDHRGFITKGPAAVAEYIGLQKIGRGKTILVFDEIHKYAKWKIFLKGFFDTYQDHLSVIVTGSSKLDVYRRGGDSLMGRYFPYRIHPLSVAECLRTTVNLQEIHAPQKIQDFMFERLFNYGGFPEPFLQDNKNFFRRWQDLRHDQLFRDDIRDLSRIQEIGQLEVLAELLKNQAGQLTNYSNLANKVNVSVDTVKRWIKILSAFYYSFTLRPWSKNISRSLVKEPKTFLWDWSEISDRGARIENFIAAHLLKAVHFWTDQGLGKYELYFLRDKEKREVDFLVVRDNQPWFLVEAKSNDASISKSLHIFQEKTQAKHAFQVVFDMDYVADNCFAYEKPVVVPAKTFLSQLV